jgi:pullulanase
MKGIYLFIFLITAITLNSQAIYENSVVYPVYDGDDLGVIWKGNQVNINVWAPTASDVSFQLYKDGHGGNPLKVISLKKQVKGNWTHKLVGDWEGYYYTFKIKYKNTWLNEVPDPYAKAVGVNGNRGMIVNLEKTNPEFWAFDKSPVLKHQTDAVIYELHVRDASIHPQSGIVNKGKFLGLTEVGTKSPIGLPTGLDYIKNLGITHVHLLPSFDFKSLNESVSTPQYNWGYDPKNYNVPEGSYATNPYDGKVRIYEFKKLIQSFHSNNIGVILDVVYNHTGDTENSIFNQLVPNYYYRQNSEGGFSDASACGNETASERPMFRKFMIESLLYWVNEYHIDGFRFDLMGIHDLKTMELIRDTLVKVKPDILLYGEGWTAGGSPLPDNKRAIKSNIKGLTGIAAFSDEIRDGLKGHVFTPTEKGFISGKNDLAESVRFGIVGGVFHPQINYEKVNYTKAPWAVEPNQTVVYTSCHDNHTLWDRLEIANPTVSVQDRTSMQKLAIGIVLTSQGISFLHAGSEFLRTKKGVENSYESPDAINQMDWVRKDSNSVVVDYVQKLIQLRKTHPAFRLGNAADIRQHITFNKEPKEGLVEYSIENAPNEPWKYIHVMFNGTDKDQNVSFPYADWKTVVDDQNVFLKPGGGFIGRTAKIKPFSMLILQCDEYLIEPNLKE